MKKVISFVLVLTLVLGLFSGLSFQSAADLPAYGSCGENVTYTFDSETGTLVISGSGAMDNYSSSSSPFSGQSCIESLVIENGVTSIGMCALYNCRWLTSVTIPDSVTSIGGYAFYCCKKLSSITIPDSVTSISSFAFYGCSGLTSVTIGNSVTSIGSYAFADCIRLTSVTIGNFVTYIANSAFKNCSSLKSILIPDSVTHIDWDAFCDCIGLKELTMPCGLLVHREAFKKCTNIEKVTLTKGTGTMQGYGSNSYQYTPWYISRNSLKEIVLEDGIRNIGEEAFSDCSNLTSITIPDSVTRIDYKSFYGCSSLSSIDIRSDSCTIYDSGYTIPNNIIIIINGSKNVYNYAKKYKRNYICNHVEEIDVATGPTCTKSGLTQGSHCKACGTVIVEQEETEPAWGHDYIKTAGFAATCTTTGKEDTYTCSRCSESYGGETIAALGHSYNNAVITTNPTCTSKGRQKYNCSRCDYSYYEDVAELGHDYNKTAGFAATCTKTGKADIYTCSRCGVGYGGETIAPLGHNYNKTSTTYSTCTTRGNNTYTCSRCFNSYTEQLPLAEHSYSLVNLIQKATPSKQGKITKSTCLVCGIEGETQTIFAPQEIILSTNSFTYSGKQCKPAVTVKDSAGKVIDSYHYTVAYSNNTNAGTARVTVTFKGDYYEGSMSKTFKIVPKKLTNCYLDNTFTYTGKAITPMPYYYKTVVQTFDGEQYTEKALTYFKKGTEYTIAVSGKHTQVGTYTVVIRFCGNYTGTVKKSIQIRPKPVTKSNTKPYSETSIKISWNKVAGVSGYSVFRYNIQKSKWERYKNTTATSMIVPRINASYTDVWLRIWTYKKVGGKVYYNESAKAHDDFEYTKPGKPIVKLVNTDFGNFVMKFNRVAWHQTQLSDNKAFSNKGENICVTYRNYNSKVTATGWGSVKKYYVRTREYYYDKNNKLIVGPWSDIKTITTY